jgi:hypothetical protein
MSSNTTPATVLKIPPDTPHHMVVDRLRLAVYDTGGALCPTCQQHAQVYRWSLYGTAVQALILFHRLGGTQRYIHSNDIKSLGYRGQGDAARLRLWGLVEREQDRRDDGGRSGYWRVTMAGADFIHDQSRVRKYAWVYAGRVLQMEGPYIGIKEALGTRFNYDLMMNPT